MLQIITLFGQLKLIKVEIKVKHLVVALIYIPLFIYAQYLAYVYANGIILAVKSSLWDKITAEVGGVVYIIDWVITIFLVVCIVILLFSFIYEHKEKALLKIGSLPPNHKKYSKGINLVELAEPGDDLELLKRIEERLNT